MSGRMESGSKDVWRRPYSYREPLQLEWLGWRSDTAALDRYGWEFAETMIPVNKHGYNRRQFRMRHPDAGVVGDTETFEFHPRMHPDEIWQRMMGVVFRCRLVHQMRVLEHAMSPDSFIAVDPSLEAMRYHEHSVHDATYFAPRTTGPQKIFLEEASMKDIMDMALTKQQPDQDRIQADLRRREKVDNYRASKLKAELHLLSA